MQQETAVLTVKALLLTDLVDSTKLVEKLGDRQADRVFRRHERIARDLLSRHHGIEIDKSDGFLFIFDRPLDAVSYALNYHLQLKEMSDEIGLEIRARAGIHLGELILRENDPSDIARGAKPREVEGLAKPTAARLMSLALPGQLLLTRGAFDLARRAAVGEDPGLGKLEWLDHGAYQMKGIEEPIEVFEVGLEELSPLQAPLESEKAKRIQFEYITDVALTRAGRYQIKRKLAEGGQGCTYEAFDPVIKRKILIKQIRYSHGLSASAQNHFKQRFIREAEAAGRLSHSNIASIYDVGEEAGKPFIAMEFVEGRTLQEIIEEEGPLSNERALHYFEQLCRGLQHAHDNGIIHRDIKPSNLIVTANDRLKIVDFGVAKTERSDLTQTGTLIGTLYYMSPEQVKGQKTDHRADQFSAGVVLYQSLTGEYPFSGSHPTTIIYKIVNDPPKSIKEFNFPHSEELDEIVSKALAKNPDDRYSSCSEFAGTLRDFIQRPREKATTGASIAKDKVDRDVASPTFSQEQQIDLGEKPADTFPSPALDKDPGEARVKEDAPQEEDLQEDMESGPGLFAWLLDHKALAAVILVLIVSAIAMVIFWPSSTTSDTEQITMQDGGEMSPNQNQGTEAELVPENDKPSSESVTTETPPVDEGMLKAQAALSNGKGLYSRREFGAAINELNAALSKIRDNSEAYFMRGRSLVETQQPEKAVPDLQRAVALAPRNAEYRILLGSVFESQGQWEDAAEQFAQVSSLGGFGDLTIEALDKKITVLKTRLVLEETVPVSSEAEHDHFIGSCKGTIEMTGDSFYYRPLEKQDHALEVAIERIIRMEARNNELRVVLPGNETFNFKVEDPQKFFSVYEMVKQVLGQPTLGKTPDPEN